jgi:hypothetical protein
MDNLRISEPLGYVVAVHSAGLIQRLVSCDHQPYFTRETEREKKKKEEKA